MRRVWKISLLLALFGLLGGMAYRYISDQPSEASVANYLRSGVHGMGLGLAGWFVHLYFISRPSEWVRRWPLVIELAVRSLAMAIAIAVVGVVLQAVLYGRRVETTWLIAEFPGIVANAFAASVIVGVIFELVQLVGSRPAAYAAPG